MGTLLEEVLSKMQDLPPEGRAVLRSAAKSNKSLWVPTPGPQQKALESEADEVFFGGSAGCGKSQVILGAAITQHTNSLILRRYGKDAKGLSDTLLDDILHSRAGFNGTDLIWRGRTAGAKRIQNIEFAGCLTDDDKQRFKGRPRDLYGFDEIGDFMESQYRFIIGWNRTTVPGQRCRVICAGNPPTEVNGLWVIRYWAPWLDPTHPNPAADGELRWYTTIGGVDVEVDGPGPHIIDGEPDPVLARSRTFIRGWLSDNPDLAIDGKYASVLASLPAELRAAYRDGNFGASMTDDPWQVFPTEWLRAAQNRWTPEPPMNVPMCAIGVDVAQGGADNNVLAPRYDGWFAPLILIPGKDTPLGRDVSGSIISNRRNNCHIIIDCGGGYGGTTYVHLKDNGIPTELLHAYKGSEKSERRSRDGQLPFYNKRAEINWRFREALDPGQPGGSTIMIPPDPTLFSDLAAVTFEVTPQGIKLITKEDLTEKLGRSPDRGDAVTMSWHVGDRIATSWNLWQSKAAKAPKVVHSHTSARSARRA